MFNDRLFEIFKQHLYFNFSFQSETQLIRAVVCVYTLEVMSTGTIPESAFAEVMADIEEEVITMYRKATYGFTSLRSFQNSLGKDH